MVKVTVADDRYNYFDFDEESRSFICPVCMGVCNCKSHLDKRNLGHLAIEVGGFDRHTRTQDLRVGETVQQYIERVGNPEPPFDRVRLVNMAEDVVAPPLTHVWEEYLEDQRCARLGIVKKTVKPSPKPGGKGKGGKRRKGPSTGDNVEPGEDKGAGGKGKGKGKGGKGKGAPRTLKPRGGKDKELVEQVNAAAANGEPKRKTGKKRLAEDDTQPAPAKASKKDTTGTGTVTPASESSGQIFLRFQPPARVREVDSDGDSVYGYSSDEGLWRSRSRSRSLSISAREAPGTIETTNDFLARMASAVVPTVPPLDEHLWDAPLDPECLPSLDMAHPEPGLTPFDGLSVEPPTMAIPTFMSDPPLPIPPPTPGRLRLTLAPSIGPTTSFETLHGQPSASPRTPRRRGPGHGSNGSTGHVRLSLPELSPPGQDPLPALYPSFPELERSYMPYPSYPPAYSPPAYSSHVGFSASPRFRSPRTRPGLDSGERYAAREWARDGARYGDSVRYEARDGLRYEAREGVWYEARDGVR